MASRIQGVELIKGFVVNFGLLLNVNLIVGTTFLINGHGLNYNKSVAKRKACLQPEKTHGYQYLFAVQFFDSYVCRSRINKGH